METTPNTTQEALNNPLPNVSEPENTTTSIMEEASATTTATRAESESSYDSDWDFDTDFELDLEGLRQEDWHEITDRIVKTTRDAFSQSPASTTDLDLSTGSGHKAFQSYWRGVFNDLVKEIMEDENIPPYVTCPPTKRFNIYFYAENPGHNCPCMYGFPRPRPNILIENEKGVTKGDVIRAVVEYLYGSDGKLPVMFCPYEMEQYKDHLVTVEGHVLEVAGEVDKKNYDSARDGHGVEEDENDEAEYLDDASIIRYCFPALVYFVNWMVYGKNVYNHLEEGPNLWFYCCKPGEFLDRMRVRDGLTSAAEAGGELESSI